MKSPNRILVVEDSRTQAAKLQSLLQEWGYQVELSVTSEPGKGSAFTVLLPIERPK